MQSLCGVSPAIIVRPVLDDLTCGRGFLGRLDVWLPQNRNKVTGLRQLAQSILLETV